MPSAPPVDHPLPPAVIATASSHPVRRSLAWALPLVLIAFLYLGASFGPALYDQNEAQYAGAVREMMNRPQDYTPATRDRLERGHWYIPTNDGIPRLQKPPLVYWLLMGSMRVFGVNVPGARLPNAVFTLLWFWATFLLGRRIAGAAFGRAGATILATMAGTFIFSHLIAPEPFLAAFLTLTFWCFLGACQEPARAGRWMFLAWVFMGMGVCSKGLHGALYPLMVAGLLAWRHPETRPAWKKLWQPAGILVFLLILLPWYVAIALRYPGFLHDQFINEQLGHVINRRYPPDNDRVPVLVFWLEHLVLFLPWTFFIPGGDPDPVPGGCRATHGFVGPRPARLLVRCDGGDDPVFLVAGLLSPHGLDAGRVLVGAAVGGRWHRARSAALDEADAGMVPGRDRCLRAGGSSLSGRALTGGRNGDRRSVDRRQGQSGGNADRVLRVGVASPFAASLGLRWHLSGRRHHPGRAGGESALACGADGHGGHDDRGAGHRGWWAERAGRLFFVKTRCPDRQPVGRPNGRGCLYGRTSRQSQSAVLPEPRGLLGACASIGRVCVA